MGRTRHRRAGRMARRGAALLCFLSALLLPGLSARAEDGFVLLEDTGAVEVSPGSGSEITGTISVKLPENPEFNPSYLFKIMDAEYVETSATYELSWKTREGASYVEKWASDFFNDTELGFTAYAAPEALAEESPVQQAAVYEALLEWIKATDYGSETSSGFVYHTIPEADGGGERVDHTDTFSDMPLGQYLYWLPDSDVPLLTLTLLPVRDSDGSWRLSNVSATLKYGVVDIEKSVDCDQASVGDALTFTADIAVPKYGRYEENLSDTGEEVLTEKILRLEEGLGSAFSYRAGSMRINGRGSSGSFRTLPDEYFQVTPSAGGSEEGDFAIDFDCGALISEGYEQVRVTYEAELTKRAEIGTDSNQNSSVLLYTKDTGGDITEASDSVTVWTYGLCLIKADGNTLDSGAVTDDTRYLAGASFRLYRRVGVYIDIDGEDASDYLADRKKYEGEDLRTITAYGPDGSTEEGKELYAECSDSLVSTDESSGVLLSGIGAGVYLLEETIAPAGYNLLNQGLQFEIEEVKPGEGEEYGKRLESLSGFTGDDGEERADGIYELVVPNYRGPQLPESGGEGIRVYAALGFWLMAASAALLIRRCASREGGCGLSQK